MANVEEGDESDTTQTAIRVVCPRSVAKLIEPYQTCSLEEGLGIAANLFPERSMESWKKYVEILGPRMKAYRERDMEAEFESPCYPAEDHFSVNGDGLLSVCMKVHDHNKNHHELVTYDHTTKELKKLGCIPRHKFKMDIDNSVICMNDPAFVEGVLGALTDDGNFFVVLAHSSGLRNLNIFDTTNTNCVLTKNCTDITFLDCGPTGIALDQKSARCGRFNIAILNQSMEVQLWNPTTLSRSAVKLKDSDPSFCLHRFVINPRESCIKFSPDGQWLSVLAYFNDECCCVCILLDASNLEPVYMLPYAAMYSPLCSLFPCFANCQSKVAIFDCLNYDRVMHIDEYKLIFFEIPLSIQSLKNMCKSFILNVVADSKLSELPLPSDLIEFLRDNSRLAPSSENENKKPCHIM